MKISGFSMAKNATKLYYPIRQVVESILPIVDEFVIAIGDCDEDDRTREEVEAIGSDKIKIIDTVWDIEQYPRGMEHAHQTDIAKNACSGDWCFYLQADEVVHEKYHDTIVQACKQYKDDKNVDGFLFQYLHFYGDFDHYNDSHTCYPKEIRIVRNDSEIHSYISAQSFRRIPNFNGKNYRQVEGTEKLNVVEIPAYIYHYGWVRPPYFMEVKSKQLYTNHHGTQEADSRFSDRSKLFDYGNLSKLPKFKGTHPRVMQPLVDDFDWADLLHYEKDYVPSRPPQKHEKLKYRILTWIEQNLLGGKHLFGYSNWNVVDRFKKK
ncbi:MAG: hypothetical protein R3275_13120 [Saprospiraceae bacterium]|nr:hypothetical protein [Saprospiraceae bacterium]